MATIESETFGQAFLTEPKSLAIVGQHFDGSLAVIAKREQRATKGIRGLSGFTELHQTVDAVAKVDRLDADENSQLRCELEHYPAAPKMRMRAGSSGKLSVHCRRSLAPAG